MMKCNRKFLWVIFSLCFSFEVKGQYFIKQWDQRFGGTSSELLSDFIHTKDSGYIIAGHSASGLSGDKTQTSWDSATNVDMWIVKTNSTGQKEWDKRFGGVGRDELPSVIECKDGGYAIGGTTYSVKSGDITYPLLDTVAAGSDYWMVKIDANGNKQWDKRYGSLGRDKFGNIITTYDGGYLLAGTSTSNASGDKSQDNWNETADYWIVKIDSLGNKQWDKRFGGLGPEIFSTVIQTADNGFLLAGSSQSDSSGDKTQIAWGPFYDYWVIKIDSAGSKQWDKRFGGGNIDELSDLSNTIDGGYLLGGTSRSAVGGDKTQSSYNNSPDYWVIKIDLLGNKEWDKRFGGNGAERLFSVTATTDIGYLLSGTSISNITGDKSEANLGYIQPWVIKIDSSGIKQWDKTIFTEDDIDGRYSIQTSDGCYAISAYLRADVGGYCTQPNRDTANAGTEYATSDYWMLKFCMDTVTGIDDVNESKFVLLYPNPASEHLTIQAESIQAYKIVTTDGRVLMQSTAKQQPNFDIDVSTLPAGLYFLQLWDGRQQVVKKFVKE